MEKGASRRISMPRGRRGVVPQGMAQGADRKRQRIDLLHSTELGEVQPDGGRLAVPACRDCLQQPPDSAFQDLLERRVGRIGQKGLDGQGRLLDAGRGRIEGRLRLRPAMRSLRLAISRLPPSPLRRRPCCGRCPAAGCLPAPLFRCRRPSHRRRPHGRPATQAPLGRLALDQPQVAIGQQHAGGAVDRVVLLVVVLVAEPEGTPTPVAAAAGCRG